MHQREDYENDALGLIEAYGWILVAALLPMGIGIALYKYSHKILGCFFIAYGVLIAFLGLVMTEN